MGSVYVNWEGTCRERAVQEELVGFLRELAECSQTRCRGPAPARSAFLTLMRGPREQNAPRIEPIRMFDQEITGRIVLDPKLARDGQALHDEVQRLKPEMIAISPTYPSPMTANFFFFSTSSLYMYLFWKLTFFKYW